MKRNRLSLRIVIPAALICVLVMLVASADNITSSDPLISLSYLNGTFKTGLLQEVRDAVNTEITEMENRLNLRIDGIKAASTAQQAAAPTHSTATIPANASYTVPGGSEFLFLSGNATVSAAGLSDLTDGNAVTAQSQLAQYHLYSAASPVIVKASTPSKIIIRK